MECVCFRGQRKTRRKPLFKASRVGGAPARPLTSPTQRLQDCFFFSSPLQKNKARQNRGVKRRRRQATAERIQVTDYTSAHIGRHFLLPGESEKATLHQLIGEKRNLAIKVTRPHPFCWQKKQQHKRRKTTCALITSPFLRQLFKGGATTGWRLGVN